MSGQLSGSRVQEGAKDTRKKMVVSTASASFKKPWKRVSAAVPPSSSLGREGRRRENRGGTGNQGGVVGESRDSHGLQKRSNVYIEINVSNCCVWDFCFYFCQVLTSLNRLGIQPPLSQC